MSTTAHEFDDIEIHDRVRRQFERQQRQATSARERRERIATKVMQGILSNGEMMTAISLRANIDGVAATDLVVANALAYADTLILRLDATE